MTLAKIAIVGRPNVGKSALFNRICKKRISIVDEAEGITRDRIIAKADIFGTPFEIIDTAGIGHEWEDVKEQIEIAIEEADRLVMVVDSRIGLTEEDMDVAKIVRRSGKEVFLAVNKVDNRHSTDAIHEFHRLGFKKIYAVSALQGFNIAELFIDVLDGLESQIDPRDEKVRVTFIGRANVGKSTLVNQLAKEKRCVVRDVPGTTRDKVDIHIGSYTFTDTAGIRRKSAEKEVVDKFAVVRTLEALKDSDVAVLLLDAREGMTRQEKRIMETIEAAGKGLIIFFNKWDLIKEFRMEHCLKQIRDEVPFLNFCPVIFGSAKTGRNMEQLVHHVDLVKEAMGQRVPTGALNSAIEKIMQKYHPPMIRGKRLRLYYTTQVKAHPPIFVSFANYPDLMTGSYKRYLTNELRKVFPFTGVPLVHQIRQKARSTPNFG
ncbi:MAG: GTPase Der [Chlamydiia bacterium]|nr:GTPase Der [Chlamydiia bacterium]MCH9616622.1 GTPase Der [Chlamydiia bacterium]MCH9629352.1 GTPase Der [Chlamydiia bacterium]